MVVLKSLVDMTRNLTIFVFISGTNINDIYENRYTSVSIDYEVDTLPPTCTVNLPKAAGWIRRSQELRVYTQYKGEQQQLVFTGKIKRVRRTENGASVDAVGMTAALTRQFRLLPKIFVSTSSSDAVANILDNLPNKISYDAPFDTTSFGSSDDFTLGGAKPAVLDVMTASDMIRKIADINGHRMFELPSGQLIIRPLFEAPTGNPARHYTTGKDTGFPGRGTAIPNNFPSTPIAVNTNLSFGNAVGSERVGQEMLMPEVGGGHFDHLTLRIKKVGSPTDTINVVMYRTTLGEGFSTDGAPVPNDEKVYSKLAVIPASALSGSYQDIDIDIFSPDNYAKEGDSIWFVVQRDGAINGSNYFQIERDSTGSHETNSAIFSSATGKWTNEGAGANLAGWTASIYQAFTPRILSIADDEDEDQIKKKVYVRGTTLEILTEGEDASQDLIEQTAVTHSNSLVAGDPDLYSMVYQNSLIDTDAQAAKTALRLLDKYHRVIETIEISIPYDPGIRLGMSVFIDDDGDDDGVTIGHTGSWWIAGYSHNLSATDATTSLSLFGGDQSGTVGEVLPQADFTYTQAQMPIGSGIRVQVQFRSYATDQDGHITNWAWTDTFNGGTLNVSGGDLETLEVTYNPTVDDTFNVTHTVIDDDGNSSSTTQTITLDFTEPGEGADALFIPVVVVAGHNTAMSTIDGGLSWNDIPSPDGGRFITCAMTFTGNPDGRNYMFWGTDSGILYRSDDNGLTMEPVFSPVGGSGGIADVVPDPWDRGTVWVMTKNGQIQRADEFGAPGRWVIWGSPGGTGGRRQAQSPYNLSPPSGEVGFSAFMGMGNHRKMLLSPSRVFIFGGHGDDLESWMFYTTKSLGYRWSCAIMFGDGTGVTTATDPDAIVIDAAISDGDHDIALVFEDRNKPMIHSNNWGDVPSANWTNVLDLEGLVDAVGVEGNDGQAKRFMVAQANNDSYYTTDAREFEVTANAMPGTGSNITRSLTGLGGQRNAFLAGTDEGVAITLDHGLVWDFIRPSTAPTPATIWPVGASAKDIAIEYRRPTRRNIAIIAHNHTTDTDIATRTEAGGWFAGEDLGGFISDRWRLYHFTGVSSSAPSPLDDTVFRLRYSGNSTTSWNDLIRSEDRGITFPDNVLTDCGDVAISPDGSLWATGSDGSSGVPNRIFRSTNGGDTWDTNHTVTNGINPNKTRLTRIRVDTNNEHHVMAVGMRDGTDSTKLTVMVTGDALAGSPTWSRIVSNVYLTPRQNLEGDLGDLWLLHLNAESWLMGYTSVIGIRCILRTTNDGASWSYPMFDFFGHTNFVWMHAIKIGEVIFVAGRRIGDNEVSGVWKSTDGEHWEKIVTTLIQPSAVAYQASTDTLYVGADGTGVNTVTRIVPPNAGVPLRDVTDNLNSVLSYSEAHVNREGMVAFS